MSELNSAAGYSRRTVLAGGAAATAAAATTTAEAAPAARAPAGPVTVDLDINGRRHSLSIDARTTLLDTLREHLSLTGAKKGCDHGQCGACTVHVGGRRVLSCLTLAITVQQEPIVTIEGIGNGNGGAEALHPMQAAFIAHDAFQCGYCTPGQIMSAIACVREGHASDDAEIREYMSGNLCRCAAYPNIVAAIKEAAPAVARERTRG